MFWRDRNRWLLTEPASHGSVPLMEDLKDARRNMPPERVPLATMSQSKSKTALSLDRESIEWTANATSEARRVYISGFCATPRHLLRNFACHMTTSSNFPGIWRGYCL